MSEEILYDVSDWVATITLNRPDKLNAWTVGMEEQANARLREAAVDDRVRAIVLTGAGRGFCAGADMSLLSGLSESQNIEGRRPTAHHEALPGAREDFNRRYGWYFSIPKPLIAAINGPAVGLGFVIPLFCDMRIAAASASFSAIFSKRGLVAEYGSAWMLPRMVGLANAIDILFTSRKLDAAEALRIGLVNRVFPDDGFLPLAQAFARELATTVSPRSLALMKQQIYNDLHRGVGEALNVAYDETLKSFSSEDFKEGVRHFMEKRPPQFPGR